MDNNVQLSEDALIERVKEGDGAAAAQLYTCYTDHVSRICFRIVLDSSQVKDCTQEVWLKFFRSVQRYKSGSSVKSWLTTIAVNTAIDFYRKQLKSVNKIDLDELHTLPSVSRDVCGRTKLEEKEIQSMILKALTNLSVSQRTAFMLRFFEQASTAEIAEILGCAEGTVRSHIRRAILFIRKRLSNTLAV